MFKSKNFCHVASNNRNTVKVGVFVYRTTDDLDTVTASGYFNEKIIDINLHDLIIHEQIDVADNTKVKRNLLCVTERTLENVGTTLVKSDWEEEIDENVQQLLDDVEQIQEDIEDIQDKDVEQDERLTAIETGAAYKATDFKTPITNNNKGITETEETTLNNKIDLAANSGEQLTEKGVWYAKMYSATVAPSAEDGTNYADFSQVDGQGNPIIVIYKRQNGAWVQDQTITPPADYNGYVTITSKIWDVAEQAGQQGGKVLWSHNQKTFTPYPQIISFENASLTGNSTVQMPVTPTGDSIVNVDYVATHSGTGRNVGDIFYTSRTDTELNGAVECNGATYNGSDFVGSQSPIALMSAGKIPYVSLAQYTTLLSTQGTVGVFGWDGGSATTFRVPSLNDVFVETGTAAQVGDFIPAGLPNITGQSNVWGSNSESGALKTTITATAGLGGDIYSVTGNIQLDASKSNSIYGASSTVQPKSIRYRAMVQLATSATDEAVETCTSVLADVADLKDLSNLTSTGKSKLGPTVYAARGQILNSNSDPVAGVGEAQVYLYPNGTAVIKFFVKITTSGSSTTNFTWGINRDLLSALNSDIPTITPSGGACTYYTTTGNISTTKQGYAGRASVSGQFWLPGRVHTTSGSVGGWPPSEFAVDQMIEGLLYGTYTA